MIIIIMIEELYVMLHIIWLCPIQAQIYLVIQQPLTFNQEMELPLLGLMYVLHHGTIPKFKLLTDSVLAEEVGHA